MQDDPQSIAAGITRLESVTGVWELADRRLEAGDAGFVAELGIALWRRFGADTAPPWQYRSAFDRMLRLLTLTPGTIEQATRLISVAVHGREVRYAASLLASAHTATELGVVFDTGGSEELRVCLLQELVLRGAEVGHAWAASPHWRHHPLAWLPMSLAPIEGQPSLPHYGINGTSGDLPGMTVQSLDGHGSVPAWRETTTASEVARLEAAVRNWADASNGRVEARTFVFDGELEADAVGEALVRLGLESARDMSSREGACSAAHAWGQLFTAASAGGAYGRSEFGAYGRLLAWRSVAALAGAVHDTSPPDVEAQAQRCWWYSFAGSSDWFERIAWDIGLAVVSPDRRRLAVLAATDTD